MAFTVASLGDVRTSSLGATAGILIALPFMRRLPSFTVPGRFVIVTQLSLGVVAVAWGVNYVWTLDVSTTTRLLMLSGTPLVLLTLPFGVVALVPLIRKFRCTSQSVQSRLRSCLDTRDARRPRLFELRRLR
jgi:hypothetical protein